MQGSLKDGNEHGDAMKDIDLRTIQPVHGHRKPDKASKAEPASGQAFGKVLDTTLARASGTPAEPPTVTGLEQKLAQEGQQIRATRDGLKRLLVDMQLLGKAGKPRSDPDGRG